MWRKLLNSITTNPVNLTFKTQLWAVIACAGGIFLVGVVARQLIPAAQYSLLVASMGASAVILFITPNSPMAQPWQMLGGHLVSAGVGVSCAGYLSNPVLGATAAIGFSVIAMLLLRCVHPPGAATALVPVLSTSVLKSGYDYVLMPVGVNAVSLLLLAILINRYLLKHDYPAGFSKVQSSGDTASAKSEGLSVSEAELEKILQNQDVYLDVLPRDLSKLISEVQQQAYKRMAGEIICADIMQRNVPTVNYGTDVEAAWHLMLREDLKALPVIDRARRVVGIISWNDFFKYLDADKPGSFREKFISFVTRTPGLYATKPESVGHIMTRPVSTLAQTAHIVELIPLMSAANHGQIPIVDHEQRLVGIIDQAMLIAVLYRRQGAK